VREKKVIAACDVTFDEDRNRFSPETWVGTWEDAVNVLKRLSIEKGNVETGGDTDGTSAAESSEEESVNEEVDESTNGTLRRSSRETRPPGYLRDYVTALAKVEE